MNFRMVTLGPRVLVSKLGVVRISWGRSRAAVLSFESIPLANQPDCTMRTLTHNPQAF